MADLDDFRAEDDKILRDAEAEVTKAALDALNDLARDLRAALKDEQLTDAEANRLSEPWQMALDGRILPALEQIYAEAFDWQMEQFGVTPNEDGEYATRRVTNLAQENARAYVRTIRNRLVGVADEIFKDIRAEIRQGMEAEETPEQIARRIDAVFANRGGNNWLGRASVIAQTETTAAVNMGRLQAARKYARDQKTSARGVIKTWITQQDDRVRDSHQKAHGQRVPLTQKFVVGGFRMRAPGDPLAPPELVINCRCTVRFSVPSRTASGGIDMDEKTEVVPWHGVLAPEGVLSGDGRKFTEGALRHRDLPLPLLYQDATADGHDGAVRVGRIDGMTRAKDGNDTTVMRAWGVLDTHDTAIEAARQLENEMLRGVSVDVDDATFEFENADGEVLAEDDGPLLVEGETPIMAVTDGRISGATLCSIPAFQEAFVTLGLPPEEWGIEHPDTSTDEEEVVEVNAAADLDAYASVSDKPWSDFTQADYSDEQWYRACVLHKNGDSRAKSDNGLPIREPSGTLNRNAVHAAAARFNQVDAPAEAKSSAKSALRGAYKAIGEDPPEALAAAAITAPAFTIAEALVASAAVADDFADPHLGGPTPLTVDGTGRIVGHLATWGTCHIGVAGQCVTPPSSRASYAYFHTGAVLTASGEAVPVGRITLGTGHANPRLAPRPAMDHYDNTGTVVADVVAGEDAYGIWVSGRLRPGVTDEQKHSLQAAALSGDWRSIGGNLELVAALAVNTAGFPIPRTQSAMKGGRQIALVASGVVTGLREDTNSLVADQLVKEIRGAMRRADERKRRVNAAAKAIGRDRQSRMMAAAALVRGGQ